MICIIIVLVFIINNSNGSHSMKNHDDVVEIFDEKSGNSTTNDGSLREMTNRSVEYMSHQRLQRSAPLIYRWTDGQRISGDRVSVTPWDDYDFNGSKDYEYQLSYRGCQINKIEVRLLIVIFVHSFFISTFIIK